jgi:hypothetical protein
MVALEKLWTDKCTVYIYEKTLNENTKRTEFQESALLQNQPCRVSYKTLNSVATRDFAPEIAMQVKLFISNAVTIPAGSKISVTRGDMVMTYKNSGKAAVYSTHQEIPLELFEEWA